MTAPSANDRRLSPQLAIALSAGAASIAAGVWVALDPAVTGAALVALPLFGALGWWLAGALTESPEDCRTARRIYLAALLLRLPILLFIHLSIDPNTLAPDQVQYDRYSVMLLDYWKGAAPYPSLYIPEHRQLYFSICAAFYWLFGQSPLGPKFLNAAAGALSAAVVYRLGRLLSGSHRASLYAGVLAAFMPSLLLWNVLQVRDPLAVLGLLLVFESFLRFQREPSFLPVASGFVATYFVLSLRGYLVYPLAASIVGGLLVGKEKSLSGRRGLAAVSIFILVLVGTIVTGTSETLLQDLSFEKLQQHRESLALGGTAFAPEADISSAGAAILHLPLGLVYFLLGPFPWQIATVRQMLAVPEMLAWYALLPFVLFGASSLWQRLGLGIFALAGFIASTTLMYALVEGNVGTAFRHRAQVLVFVFLFAGEGLSLYQERRAKRKESRGAAPKAIQPIVMGN